MPKRHWAYAEILTDAQAEALKVLDNITDERRAISTRTLHWLHAKGFINVVDDKPVITPLGKQVISEYINRKKANYYRRHSNEIPQESEDYFREQFGIVRRP